MFVVTREYVPFFARFEAHYAVPLGRKKTSKAVNIGYEHVVIHIPNVPLKYLVSYRCK